MKKTVLFLSVNLLFCLGIFAQKNDPTVLTINGKKIHLSEFEYIYNKNNDNNSIEKKSVDEYVNMFVDFKLKVAEAETLGLDTTRAFNSEYSGYVKQLSDQYLKPNSSVLESSKEIAEVRNYMNNEVDVSQILIKVDDKGTTNDTLQAYKKANEVYKRVLKEDFEKVALETSDDPMVKRNKGNLGWIPMFRVPSFDFEKVAFSTPIGKVAKPFRTRFGYHIVKVNGKRKSKGQVKVAHIFLMDNQKDKTVTEKNKLRIDSIYTALKGGAKFSEMVQLSEDPASKMRGGELPYFGSGQMIPTFEKVAFAMKDSGSLSKPFHSRAGWHIVQFRGKKPKLTREEKNRVINNHLKIDEKSFFNGLKSEYKYHRYAGRLEDFYKISEKYAPNDSLFLVEVKKLNKPLFTFAGNTFTQKQFTDYLVGYLKGYKFGVRTDFLKNSYDNFLKNQLYAYERIQLPKKYPDYRNLLNEYHDGILLFEVMNQEVWNKAMKDTVGLTKFFNKNKKKYKWEKPHYKGKIIYCKDKETLKAAKRIVKYADKDLMTKYLYQRLNDSIRYVKIEQGVWEKGENSLIDDEVYGAGKYTPSKEYPYFILVGKNLKKNPQTYLDVKGRVVTDYQNYLEKTWIESLRKKYPVVINRENLKKVNKK